MATVTVTKLSDTVGAEVTGVDVDQLVTDDSLAGTIMDALEENGVLVFRGLHIDPESQVEWCHKLGEIDMTPGHHPVPGIYRVTLDTLEEPPGRLPARHVRLAHRRLHPEQGRAPAQGVAAHRPRRRREGRRDRVRQHVRRLRRPRRRREGTARPAPRRARARGVAAAGHARPHARAAGRVAPAAARRSTRWSGSTTPAAVPSCSARRP